MKISEVTVSNIADYLRLETGEYTNEEIQVLIDTAKSFIKHYTGIENEGSSTEEIIGIGDGETTAFYTMYNPIVLDTLVISVDANVKAINTDYTVRKGLGLISFITAPAIGEEIKASYTFGLDSVEEFVIVLKILCQDMYDNRSYYVEKSNINRVISTILDMHSRNLVPSPNVG